MYVNILFYRIKCSLSLVSETSTKVWLERVKSSVFVGRSLSRDESGASWLGV